MQTRSPRDFFFSLFPSRRNRAPTLVINVAINFSRISLSSFISSKNFFIRAKLLLFLFCNIGPKTRGFTHFLLTISHRNFLRSIIKQASSSTEIPRFFHETYVEIFFSFLTPLNPRRRSRTGWLPFRFDNYRPRLLSFPLGRAERENVPMLCSPVSLVVEIISFSLLPFFFFFIPSQPEVKLARDIGERKVGGRGWFSRSFICRVLWVTGRIFAGPRNKFTDDLYGWLNERNECNF